MLTQSPCTFDLNYKIIGTGLNNEDYEFEPFVALWTSWGKNNRAIADNLLYTGAIIKKLLKKGEKVEKKAKEKFKKAKESKVGKKIVKRYKKEKQGIKEFKQERKARKQREKEAKQKKTKTSKLLLLLDDDFESSDGTTSSETSSEMSDTFSTESEEDETETETETTEEEPEEEYASESEEEYLMSKFNTKHGSPSSIKSDEKEIKCYKESRTLGPFSWPGTEEEGSIKLRGDENVWLKLYIHTRHSGQASIDKREAPFIKRIQQAGVMKIPINNILIEIAKWMNNMEIDKSLEIKRIDNNQIKVLYKTVFFAPKLAKIQYNELIKKGIKDQKAIEEAIINTCTKAEIINEITINNLTVSFIENTLQKLTSIQNQYNNIKYEQFVSLMKQNIASSSPSSSALVVKTSNRFISSFITQSSSSTSVQQTTEPIYIPFGSSLHEAILEKSMTPLINNYISSLFSQSPFGDKTHKALYSPTNKQVENLHLAYYSTEQGDEPVMGYLLRNRKEFDIKSEKYFLIQLIASLKRNGLTPDYFIKIVDEQFKRTDSTIIHNYMKCVESVYNLASFAATQILYTSDFRYGNDQFVKRGKQIQMDSWDMDISQGISNCDDCEGMGSLDLEILDSIQEGRILDISKGLKGWESPILETARKILLSRSHSGVAGTVNDAFIDASGQKISSKKIKDLPVIGEEIDLNSTVGGHFHGLSIPNAIIVKWLKNSVDITKDNITQELRDFINKEFKPWQYEENILVLEGTGNIDPYILPIETSFKNDKIEFNKRKYQKELTEFIKTSSKLNEKDEDEDEEKGDIKTEQALIKKNLESHKPNELFILNHMISAESQPFYIKNTKEHNRISKFYKDIVHILSKTLFTKDNSFSQCVFCYKDKRSFGVDIGDILRDLGNKESNIMIIRPLIPVNKDHWTVLINPLLDTIKRQQPISIIGNFTQEEESKLISKRLFQQEEESVTPTPPTTTTLLNNYMHLKGNEKIIKVTTDKGYYIINGKINNPILVLEQGVHYNIEVNAKGHPFWILTKNDKKFKKNIENNGTDKGTIKIFIPCDNKPSSFLRYQCGNHSYMNGSIAIELNDKCFGSSSSSLTSNEGTKRPTSIDYKYEKPKWHFEEVSQNDNQTIMKFFFRSFNIEKHPGFLKCLKDEISYLMKHKGIVDYAFYEHKFFPQGESLVELLLMCNIKK